MLGSLVPVAAASLLGSLHCAAMCGGFVAAYAGTDSDGRERWLSHIAYNGGRLVTYTLLGAVAGTLGSALDLAGRAAGLAQAAGLFAGISLISWGLFKFFRVERLVQLRLRPPSSVVHLPVRIIGALARQPPILRSGLLGLSSTLLPCGWLYAFAVGAAGTASALNGAALMAAFWLGSVPALLGVGVSLQALTARFRRHLPRLSAAVVVVVGIATVIGRFDVPAFATAEAQPGAPSAGPHQQRSDCPLHARSVR